MVKQFCKGRTKNALVDVILFLFMVLWVMDMDTKYITLLAIAIKKKIAMMCTTPRDRDQGSYFDKGID